MSPPRTSPTRRRPKPPTGSPTSARRWSSNRPAPSSNFEATLSEALGSGAGADAGLTHPPAGGVQVAGIVADKTPDQQVYDPGNPEADAQGYVKMPNVNTVTEMVDLISESRSYQSDVTAMQTAKSMFTATLGILK